MKRKHRHYILFFIKNHNVNKINYFKAFSLYLTNAVHCHCLFVLFSMPLFILRSLDGLRVTESTPKILFSSLNKILKLYLISQLLQTLILLMQRKLSNISCIIIVLF